MRTISITRIHIDLATKSAGIEFVAEENAVKVNGRHQVALTEEAIGPLREEVERLLSADDSELGKPPPAVLTSLLHQLRERKAEVQEATKEILTTRAELRALTEAKSEMAAAVTDTSRR